MAEGGQERQEAQQVTLNPGDLPHLNAALNGAATILLIGGFVLIRRKRWYAHAACMIGATVMSALFLTSYLVYHYHVGEQSTAQMSWLPPWLRYTYLAILFPHIILATVMLPMILMTFVRAIRLRWDRHMRIARPTLWVWLYVSVTGVVIYWMLYHLFPGMRV
jgi:uncharacterized membrane protein YozB (DUF420 family)